MQKDKHPKIYKTTVKCISCGNSFETHSTSKEIRVDVCSNCHPFYNGQLSNITKKGRIDKFQKRLEKSNKTNKGKNEN